jgi:hypothetical protein
MASSNDRPEILDTLAAGISRLANSAEWKSWLDAQRRFHRYSFGNTLLIAVQRPDATQVAGFHAWLGMSRHVRKGEKGIAIIAPVVSRVRVKDEETGTEAVVTGPPKAFRVAHVLRSSYLSSTRTGLSWNGCGKYAFCLTTEQTPSPLTPLGVCVLRFPPARAWAFQKRETYE